MHRILVVDDELEIIELLDKFLNKMGFESITALGGEKAIEILKSQAKIDLMILDLKMPKAKGVDVLKEMERINRKIPVIILSGTTHIENYADDLENLGYNEGDILYKPIDLYTLLDKIKKKLPQESK